MPVHARVQVSRCSNRRRWQREDRKDDSTRPRVSLECTYQVRAARPTVQARLCRHLLRRQLAASQGNDERVAAAT
ncbi:hypothetical protein PI124_g21003 [Phytophthora idaei]|nr:hypothetical protein PI125_g22578 [Phytophthora idaei]KAG3129885.1 hypothetical protein PI126_g20749 [Phytophthora idaei]KAG3233934.1 hypothetical protein PI124_g21003 [Phytophthora idaei]